MTTPTRLAKRVLLVGWDGADWNTAKNMMTAEGLPNLAALLRSGASGSLVAAAPRILEAQWTSLITGQRPHKHGALHASQPLRSNRGTSRVTRPTVRTATLGAILSASGHTVHQVSWPVSHPAENLRGVVVSDHFASEGRPASIEKSGGWPWVTPPIAAAELFARRCSPQDIDEVALAQLAPADLLAGAAREHLLRVCRLALADTLTVFRAAKWCMDRAPWDCTLCTFPAPRRLRHTLKMLPPEARSEEVETTVLKGCYEYLDMLLGQLVASAGEGATICVASMGHSRAVQPVFGLSGLGVQSGSLPQGASVLDVTPTLLTMLGIPVASDMDGRVWTEVLMNHDPEAVQTVETWSICVHPPRDDAACSATTADVPCDPSVEHLVALGYADPVENAAREKAEQCFYETQRNRALSLLDAGEVDEAVALLCDLKSQQPLWPSPRELLAEVYAQRRQRDLAESELEFLIHHGAESARLYFVLGRLALDRRELDDALWHFHVAERISGNLRGLRLAQASALVRHRDFSAAQKAFQDALRVDGPSPSVLDGLAVCSLALGECEQAADFALAALEQDIHYAKAHYHLGMALMQLGRLDDAQRVFEASAAVDPQMAAPWRWLARLAEDYLRDPKQAEAYRAKGRQLIRSRRRAPHCAAGNA